MLLVVSCCRACNVFSQDHIEIWEEKLNSRELHLVYKLRTQQVAAVINPFHVPGWLQDDRDGLWVSFKFTSQERRSRESVELYLWLVGERALNFIFGCLKSDHSKLVSTC
jgi:hypothetical protein